MAYFLGLLQACIFCVCGCCPPTAYGLQYGRHRDGTVSYIDAVPCVHVYSLSMCITLVGRHRVHSRGYLVYSTPLLIIRIISVRPSRITHIHPPNVNNKQTKTKKRLQFSLLQHTVSSSMLLAPLFTWTVWSAHGPLSSSPLCRACALADRRCRRCVRG